MVNKEGLTHDEEFFDGEEWDNLAPTPEYMDWLEVHTPGWLTQINKLKEEGWLDGNQRHTSKG